MPAFAIEPRIYALLAQTLGPDGARAWSLPLSVLAIAVAAALSWLLCARVAMPLLSRLVAFTPTKWDDDLFNLPVRNAVSQLMPALVVAWLLPGTMRHIDLWHTWLTKLTYFYILWASIRIVCTELQAIYDALEHRNRFSEHNLSVLVQAAKLICILIGIVIGISILFGQSPARILTALGASAAILMLVFKDTILGFVAGIQLSVNKMLKVGDWIISEKAHANGEVLQVKLTTVKVRNWDNSVTTIPPYTLISDSFQNYQNMREHGLRRVARSIYIDVNTIRFCTPVELQRLREAGWLTRREAEEGERKVNLALLRQYLEKYLAENSEIETTDPDNTAILMMVRQLQPTPQGLPLELYFFTTRTGWRSFEVLQSEIFDHVYAVVGEFGLRMYQAPAGTDIEGLRSRGPSPLPG